MLTEAGDALGCADRKELSYLVRRYQADKPLWDRQAIQPRPSSSNDHAVDEGDKAPPSWDHTTDASVPAALAQDIAAVSAPPLHGAAAQSNRLDSNLSGQSSSQPPSVKSPAGRLTAAELEAKMAETAQRIAAMKAAAKARKVVPADLSADSKAPDSSAKPQIRSMPLQTGSVPAGATDSTSPAARVLEAVVRPSLPALHRHNTHTGKQPASNHNHQQLRMPHDQQSRPSSPKHDLSHSQGDATASSHDSAHPGQPQPACSPSATGAASRDAQLAPGTFGKQQHGRTGRSAPSLPTRHQPVQTRNSAMLTSMVSNQHNYGSHKQEAQNRPASQAHLDPSSWHVVDWLNGSSTAAAACDGAVLQPNGSKHCQPAANMQVQGQQHGNYRSGSQPNMRSCANAAMSVTAMWMSVLNSHVPLILSQGAPTAMEIDSNPKSAVPNAHAPPDEHKTTDTQAAKTMRRMASAASAQSTGIASTAFCGPTASHMTSKWAQTAGSPTSRDCATLMDIDAPSLSPALISHKQCHQTPFGEPPQAAFGHGHCDGLQWHKLHLQVPAVHGPSDSAVSANCAMMHADDQSVAMDTNDDMQRRT